MITFYFRGMPSGGPGKFKHGMDSLCSWQISAEELWREFGPAGKNESIHIVAEFDDSTTPPTLKYRSTLYVSFQEMRQFREDFPAFFLDETDGCIWESEQLGGWGKLNKQPVMHGPNATA